MKRDFDLVRSILFAVEAMPEGSSLSNGNINIAGYAPEQISGHVQMLQEAGFVSASISRELGPVTARGFHIYRLTWAGHEFLDVIRDSDIWTKTKSRALSKGAALTFDLAKAIATAYIKETLGLA